MGTRRHPMRLAAALVLGLAVVPGPAQALQKPFSDLAALDDQRLDELRGGVNLAPNLMATVGFERVVSINGQETFRQVLVFDNLALLLEGIVPGLQVSANLGQVIQNGSGNFVGSTSQTDARAQALQNAPTASAITPPATSAPATSVPTEVASAPTSPATSGAAANSAAGTAAATPGAAPAAVAAPPATAPASAATAGMPVSASAAPASASTTAPATTAPAPVAAPATASPTQPMTIQTPTGAVTVQLPNVTMITGNAALVVQNSVNGAMIDVRQLINAATNAATLARSLAITGQVRTGR